MKQNKGKTKANNPCKNSSKPSFAYFTYVVILVLILVVVI